MKTDPESRAVWTMDEAAKVLGIGRALTYQLANAGTIPVLKLGRRLVVPKKALEDFINAGS